MSAPTPDFSAQVRTLQIIIAALAGGCVTFGTIAVAITAGELGVGELGVVTAVAAVFAVGASVTSLTVRVLFDKQADAGPPLATEALLGHYQTRTIVASAVLEGAAFFNLIAVIVEKSIVPLAVAALLVGFLVAGIPTKRRIAEWVAKRLDRADRVPAEA